MDPRFQTSFIPKKPIVASTDKKGLSINLFVLFSTTLFVLSIGLAVSAYVYQSILVKDLEAKKASLAKSQKQFEPELIKKIARFDSRLSIANSLVKNHLYPSSIFDLISRTTLKTVRFRDFSFSSLGKDKISVSMKGQAQSFASVALQADAFAEEKLFKNAVISDFSLDSSGVVSFSFSGTVDASVVASSSSILITNE